MGPLLSILALFITGCASQSSYWNAKIIGGSESSKGAWPWMLSLQRLRLGGDYSHTCGATLLTDTWILTAAHCVWGYDSVRDFRVSFGAFNLTAQDQDDLVYLKTILAHPDFDYDTLASSPFDIAVAELERPVDLTNPNIGLAALPRRGDSFPGNANCWGTGWGRFAPDDFSVSPILKELNGPIHTIEECTAIWEEFDPAFVELVDPRHVCFAGPDDGGCNGDSGGPMNCDTTGSGDWVVAGITSWVGDLTCLGATTMYLGTEPWLDWIEERVPGLPGVKP